MLGKPVPDVSLASIGGTPFKLSGCNQKMRSRLYGKKVRGIERSTFECRGVEVPGPVQEVLNFAKAL